MHCKMQLVAMQALAKEIADFDKDRGSRIKGAQAKLKAAKGAVEGAKAQLKNAQAGMAQAEAEAEAAAEERAALESQAAAAEKLVEGVASSLLLISAYRAGGLSSRRQGAVRSCAAAWKG